jgi:hypothetical protein
MKTFLFNPYTGTPRRPDDIKSDPEGILIAEPDAPVMVARKSMRQPECVITGLALRDGDVWVAADLFDAGDWWVVNVNCQFHGNGSVSPHWLQGPSHYTKTIDIDPGCLWFERRGIFVIHKTCATLNQAAIDYIK